MNAASTGRVCSTELRRLCNWPANWSTEKLCPDGLENAAVDGFAWLIGGCALGTAEGGVVWAKTEDAAKLSPIRITLLFLKSGRINVPLSEKKSANWVDFSF